MKKIIVFAVLCGIISSISALTCSELMETHKSDSNILAEFKRMNETANELSSLETIAQDLDCLDKLMRVNNFESAKFLLDHQF